MGRLFRLKYRNKCMQFGRQNSIVCIKQTLLIMHIYLKALKSQYIEDGVASKIIQSY